MIEIKKFKLIGLALKTKTSNTDGKSAIDCGNLWQEFETGAYSNKIPGKVNDEIFAVYYNYEGDYTRPFSYFIGCKVNDEAITPEGMESLTIPDGHYQLFKAKGKMPDCIVKAWLDIWNSKILRAYVTDFEVYGEKSKDWNNAAIDIFLSVK